VLFHRELQNIVAVLMEQMYRNVSQLAGP